MTPNSSRPQSFDSFRFLDPATTKIMRAWIKREPPREIPWTPLPKPLSQARVALISSAALALKSDTPFDQEGERQNPWWGDPSHRVLPCDAQSEDVRVYHLHINGAPGEQDLNCMLPLNRLAELKDQGVIGAVAPSHYSFMGFLLKEDALLTQTVPAILAQLQAEAVDAVALVPV